MSDKVRLACEQRIRIVPLNRILPMRMLDKATLHTTKYKCIGASIAEPRANRTTRALSATE